MPNRILKESITTSPNLNLCGFEAQALFVRIIVIADDYGRFEADPRILRARCFPLLESLTIEQVTAWRDELAAPERDCIRLYDARGRQYGYFSTWGDHQRPARSKSKYPPPPRKPPPQDVVVQTAEDHNAPQSAAIRSEPLQSAAPTTGVVSREARVVSRDSLSAGDDGDKPTVTFTPEGFKVPGLFWPQWEAAYPAVDVLTEVRGAHAWAVANPTQRKSNWHRFVVNWLKRAQDRAPRRTMQESAKGAGPAPSVSTRPEILDRPGLSPEQIATNQRKSGEIVAQLAAKKAMVS